MKALSHVRCMLSVLTDVCTTVTRLIFGVLSHKEDMDSFYEYIYVLTSHEVNPLNVPPSNLKNILLDVKNKIWTYPRLALSDHLNVNILAYFSLMHVFPIFMEDFHTVILSIHLIDKLLQMDLYRLFYLPAFHLEFQFPVFICWKAILSHFCIWYLYFNTYLPWIHICLATPRSSMCSEYYNIPSRKKTLSGVYALFIKNHELIKTHHLVYSHIQHANLTINLDRYICAVNSSANEYIQICSLEENPWKYLCW